MNCQEFDQLVTDLANPKTLGMLETGLRNSGLAHATACQHCALQLATTRALIESLGALAETTENSAASAQTEAILLAAFRRHQEVATPPMQPTVVTLPTKQSWLPRLPIWAYAAAAVLLVGAMGYASSVWNSARLAPQQVAVTPSPQVLAGISLPPIKTDDGLKTVKQNEKSRVKQTGNRERRNPIDDGSSVQASLGELIPIYREEVATDFLPLTHDAGTQPMDSGQVIRVQVPRTALASFGLPINIERANEPVKADLLLAEDGSARAIRFIR